MDLKPVNCISPEDGRKLMGLIRPLRGAARGNPKDTKLLGQGVRGLIPGLAARLAFMHDGMLVPVADVSRLTGFYSVTLMQGRNPMDHLQINIYPGGTVGAEFRTHSTHTMSVVLCGRVTNATFPKSALNLGASKATGRYKLMEAVRNGNTCSLKDTGRMVSRLPYLKTESCGPGGAYLVPKEHFHSIMTDPPITATLCLRESPNGELPRPLILKDIGATAGQPKYPGIEETGTNTLRKYLQILSHRSSQGL